MNPPSRHEIANVLRAILSGTLTRKEASEWANRFIIGDMRRTDTQVWNALKLLGGADLISTDRPFLYQSIDFQQCLMQLENQG